MGIFYCHGFNILQFFCIARRVSKPIYTCKWTWVSEWVWTHLLIWVSEWVRNHLLIWVHEWVRTHLFILVCVCVSENSPPDFRVCVWVWAHLPISVCEWVRTHLLIWVCVCVSERELTSSFVFISERDNSPPFCPSVQSHVGQSSNQ